MTPLPKPKPKPRRKLPPGLVYADYNYQMTSLQRLRWENTKRLRTTPKKDGEPDT